MRGKDFRISGYFYLVTFSESFDKDGARCPTNFSLWWKKFRHNFAHNFTFENQSVWDCQLHVPMWDRWEDDLMVTVTYRLLFFMQVKYVGTIWFIFHVLRLRPIAFFHNTKLVWIYNETYAKIGLEIGLRVISLRLVEGHVCWWFLS